MSDNIEWKVEGMSCTNCALSVEKLLKSKGAQKVSVSFIGGNVSFEKPAAIDLRRYHIEISQSFLPRNDGLRFFVFSI